MTYTAPAISPALSGDSRYFSVIQDHSTLWKAVQERAQEGGGEGLVAAIVVHAPRAVVAYIEYGEDMAYPQLRLLDLRTDEVTLIDSDDLADAPMIDAIVFKDADAGLLELQFRDGDTHTVTIDFDERSVCW